MEHQDQQIHQLKIGNQNYLKLYILNHLWESPRKLIKDIFNLQGEKFME